MLAPRTRTLFIVFLTFLFFVALILWLDFVPAPLQTPRVIQIEPPNDATEILLTTPITITFSTAMQRVETQSAISFTPRIAGNFSWRDDQTVIFTPRTALPVSTTLTINISQNARSWLQRPLRAETVSHFTTLTRPYVVSSSPALDAQFMYAPDRIHITFSRKLDGNLLADSIMLEPPLEKISLDVQDNVMTLYGAFEPRTQYRFTLPAMVADKQYGIELGRDYEWNFYAAAQYPNFSILNRGRVLKFSANAPLKIPTQFTNISRFDVALYKISQQTFDENVNAPFEMWYAFQPSSEPIITQNIVTNAQPEKYMQQTLHLDALERGTYFLKINTPESVSDAQLIFVK